MLTSMTGIPRQFPLARFIEGVQVLVPVGGQVRYDWLPDGRTSLVFRVLDGGRRGDVSLAGPRTLARVKELSGVARGVVVRFKPGWTVPFFGIAANEMTDRIVPLDTLWGREGAEFYGRLVETEGVTALLDCVSDVLSRIRSFESSSARLARRAARLLDEGEARIDRVAVRLGVTDRHLRRAFTAHVGVAPKDYARSVRLQRALNLATTSTDWGRIAIDAGYYDQAHFIADFRQLIGTTPGAFARGSRVAGLQCS